MLQSGFPLNGTYQRTLSEWWTAPTWFFYHVGMIVMPLHPRLPAKHAEKVLGTGIDVLTPVP